MSVAMDLRGLDFDLKSLPMFCLVARSESLAAAAAKLSYGITVGRLSQRMSELEDGLGYKLFDGGKKFRLTEAGARLLQATEKGLGIVADEVFLGRDQLSPKLNIGGPAAFERSYWSWILKSIRAFEPRIHPHIESLPEDVLLQRLKAGELQLIVIPLGRPLPGHFAQRKLVSLPLVMLVPKRSPIARPEDLKGEKEIRYAVALPTTSSTMIALMKKNLRRLGLRIRMTTECSLDGVLRHVADNDYIGLSLQEPNLIEHPNVRALPLEAWGTVDIGVVWHMPGTPLERRVVDLLEQRARELWGARAGAAKPRGD